MKIVCDNCATKYQIADEKVSGKAFKIRCKKCGHVIVVNKGPGDGPSQAPAAEPSVNQEAPPPAAAEAPTGTDAVWHLVIDREQVGPMTPEEVRAKVRGGQADAETYGWREGFDDWLKLSAIEDFKSAFPAGGDDQATRRTDNASRPGAPAGGAAPGADLFGGSAPPSANEPVRTANPGAATIVSDGVAAPDLAALGLSSPLSSPAPSPLAVSSPSPMAAPEPLAASSPMAQSGGGLDAPVKSMTGARSENSVLFSLNNLSALASAGGGGPGGKAEKPAMPSPQSEASGLIDIRAMAAATLGSPSSAGPASSNNRLPDLLGASDAPPVFTPLAPAVLMPATETTGVPKWVFALVGVGVLLFIGMIGVLVVVLRGDSGPTQVATNTPKDTPKESGTTTTTSPKESGTTTTNITKEPSSPGTKPTASDTPSTKPDHEKGSDRPKSNPGGSKKDKEGKSEKPSKAEKPEKSPEVTPTKVEAPPPPPKKADKPKAKDDLDSLLDSASSGSGGKPKAAEKKDLPEQLSMDTIKNALKGVNVGACKDAGASGVVQVKLTIKGNGKVSDATPSGGGAGGDCVAGKVKSAKFPEFSGDPMTLTFPFIVR